MKNIILRTPVRHDESRAQSDCSNVMQTVSYSSVAPEQWVAMRKYILHFFSRTVGGCCVVLGICQPGCATSYIMLIPVSSDSVNITTGVGVCKPAKHSDSPPLAIFLTLPQFQVLDKLLHGDLVHEDEVPQPHISVEGHGVGSLCLVTRPLTD